MCLNKLTMHDVCCPNKNSKLIARILVTNIETRAVVILIILLVLLQCNELI
jgi:hypothetical protein